MEKTLNKAINKLIINVNEFVNVNVAEKGIFEGANRGERMQF